MAKHSAIDVTIASFKVREMSLVKSVVPVLSGGVLSLGMLVDFLNAEKIINVCSELTLLLSLIDLI